MAVWRMGVVPGGVGPPRTSQDLPGPPSCQAAPGRTRASGGPEAPSASPGVRGGRGSAGRHRAAPGRPGVPGVLAVPGLPRAQRVLGVPGVPGTLAVPEVPGVPWILGVPGVPGLPGGPLAARKGTRRRPRWRPSPGTSASSQSLDSGKPGREGRVFQTQGRPITDHPSTTESEGLTWRGFTAAA